MRRAIRKRYWTALGPQISGLSFLIPVSALGYSPERQSPAVPPKSPQIPEKSAFRASKSCVCNVRRP